MIRLKARRFQTKLLLLTAAILVLLQAVTLIAVHLAARRALHATLSEELRVGARVLQRILVSRGQRLSDTAQVLAADFAFREVIALGDRPTITSVLVNHGARIHADAVFLISLEGTVEADTLGRRYVGRPFPLPELLAQAEAEASAIATLDGHPYQFIVVPVLAPEPIALVCMGFTIDQAVLDEVRRLTAMDISIWGAAEGTEVRLLSTLPDRHRRQLLGRPEIFSSVDGSRPRTIELDADRYAIMLQPLETADGSRVDMLLQRSFEEAWRPFQRLEIQIFALSSTAMAVAMVAAAFLARGVSRPLKRLAEGARRIEHGDYSSPVEVEQQDEIGQLALAFNRMGNGIREREEQVTFQATHDSLTGLPNRTLLLDRLGQALARANRRGTLVGMIVMDLDQFKEVNDTLGHNVGDDLLREVGRLLTSTMRETDTVARLGGDEFAVLFEVNETAPPLEIAQRIGKALEAPIPLGKVSVTVHASMGVSLYPIHAQDAGTLMKCADVAMYDSKESHLPVSIYEARRDEHSLRRLAILSDLRQAIDGDVLELHYQPVIDMPSARAVHAEALVRWPHPLHGMVPPNEFIPLAERSGAIRMITHWVLLRAIRDCVAWNRSGLDLKVAVNLSALDLYDERLVTLVPELLKTSGLPPQKLVLEVTESAIMKDAVTATRILGDLKAQGIVSAIDDFGTGYSSLAHLRRLPVDQLKIDKSFVTTLVDGSTEDAMMIRWMIELGHNMGLTVVAEGVETAEAWRTLGEIGCDLAQGYFISRPLPGAQFVDWMKESTWGSGMVVVAGRRRLTP